MKKAYMTLIMCILTRAYLNFDCLEKKEFDEKYKISQEASASTYIMNKKADKAGGFGAVIRVEMVAEEVTRYYIVKKLLKYSDDKKEGLLKEIDYLEILGNKGLGPKFYDCYHEGNEIFVVMEALSCSFGTLMFNKRLKKSDTNQRKKYLCTKLCRHPSGN